MCADVDVRTITESEMGDWLRALCVGFLRSPEVSDEQIADRLETADLARTRGAFDNGRCVATHRTFAQRLTAVGGRSVAADAVSNVTVSPTHRRRGLLGRMMAADLAEARERGESVSTLIAAEYPIYGRYGYGRATTLTDWEIDVTRAGLDPRWSGPADGGRVDLVDGAEVRALGPALYDRFLAAQHGAVDRDAHWWLESTNQTPRFGTWAEPFHAVYRGPGGEVEGMLVYRADAHWTDAKQPGNTATVAWHIAVTPAAERALWHFLCSVDWVTTIRTGRRAPDDLLPHLLPDPRAARIATQADWLWVRLLDVPTALEARAYAGEGSLVLEVVDQGGFAGGRYRLDATPEGATCARTTASADLTLDVADLATLWMGDDTAGRLAALGWISEERPGALARADTLLRTARRPWCPDMF